MAKRKAMKPVQLDLWGDPIEREKPSSITELIPLCFEGSSVRWVVINGRAWFVLTDVAKALGYRDAANAKRLLRSKHLYTHFVSTSAGSRECLLISEAGLNCLLSKSERPEAQGFQDRLFEEILPSIWRTGSYTAKPKTRVDREQKRLGCNPETAKARVESFATNKASAARMAEEGAVPRDYQSWHDSAYKGEFEGLTARDLRTSLGMTRGTPLDRMDAVPLSINNCSKVLAERFVRECKDAGKPLTFDEQSHILETVARELSKRELARFGPEACFGITEDPKRGRILDVVRVQLGIGQSA